MANRNRPPGEDAIIAQRRRLVASMRVRGFTEREIYAALIEARNINEKTGKPWALGTIHSDLEAIKAEWQERAQADIAAHRANLNAELEEIKRVSWREKDTTSILKAIEQQRKMLGADAPQQVELGGIAGGEPIKAQGTSLLEGIDLAKLNEEELNALENSLGILERARARQSGEGEA